MLSRTAALALLCACWMHALAPSPASAQYRRGSDPGRANYMNSSDVRRTPPIAFSPNSRFGPRANGVDARVMQGPPSQVPFDGNAVGVNPNTAITRVGAAFSAQPAAETLLPSGFRDQGRILAPAAHLQRFPPPPNLPQFPLTYTVNFPSRRDGYYAPNLVRDQAGNSAYRTPANRAEERNAYQR